MGEKKNYVYVVLLCVSRKTSPKETPDSRRSNSTEEHTSTESNKTFTCSKQTRAQTGTTIHNETFDMTPDIINIDPCSNKMQETTNMQSIDPYGDYDHIESALDEVCKKSNPDDRPVHSDTAEADDEGDYPQHIHDNVSTYANGQFDEDSIHVLTSDMMYSKPIKRKREDLYINARVTN